MTAGNAVAEAARTLNDGAKAIASALERNPVVENLFVLGNKMAKRKEDIIKAMVNDINGRKKRVILKNPPWSWRTIRTYAS